jgi:hypothetical protein
MGIDRLPGTTCDVGGDLVARLAFYLTILLGCIAGCVMLGKAIHLDASAKSGLGILLSFAGFAAIPAGLVFGAGIGLVMHMTLMYALYGLAGGVFVCLMCFAIFVGSCLD